MDNNYGQNYSGTNMSSGGKNKRVIAAVCVAVLLSVLLMLVAVYALVATDVISIGINSDKEKVESVETKKDKKEEQAELSNPEKTDAAETESTQAETPETEAAPQPVTMYVANVPESIHFRSAPEDVEENKIGIISVGEKVTFLDNADAIFAKISYKGRIGYVRREFLSTSMPKKTSSQNSGNTTVVKYMYVANVPNSIYLRSEPIEVKGNEFLQIPVGEQVGFIEITNSVFSKIKYNGKIGYAKTEFLEDYYQEPSVRYMTVTGVPNSIYLRSHPVETGFTKLGEIPVGSVVRFISYGNGTFYEIAWNEKVGYATAKYLSWN